MGYIADLAAGRAGKGSKGQSVPDRKRVFVVYGRNQQACDQMVKFLRALKLEPLPFNEVSAKCGAGAMLLDIVRRGMEEAQGGGRPLHTGRVGRAPARARPWARDRRGLAPLASPPERHF
jgi:hypothetical protein